jgi:hypothetical protein
VNGIVENEGTEFQSDFLGVPGMLFVAKNGPVASDPINHRGENEHSRILGLKELVSSLSDAKHFHFVDGGILQPEIVNAIGGACGERIHSERQASSPLRRG